MAAPTLTEKDSYLLMALVAAKGSLNREEQDDISAKLGAMGVDMSWNAVNGAFTEGEEKLLLLLMLGQDTTISRGQAAEIGQRMGRSGDTIRYDCDLLSNHVRARSLDVSSPAYISPSIDNLFEFAYHPAFLSRDRRLEPLLPVSPDRSQNLPFIMPGNNWDEARNAEVAMLFAFIEILKDGGKMTDFEGVAAKLGEGFTEAGVRQKFYKLKKESEKLLAESGDGAASAAPGTPALTNKSTKTPKSTGKRSKAVANAVDPTADDDTAATPSKRPKKSNTKVKNEPEAEEVVKSESEGGEANGDVEGEASTANGSD